LARPRLLISSPTRRSSDLQASGPAGEAERAVSHGRFVPGSTGTNQARARGGFGARPVPGRRPGGYDRAVPAQRNRELTEQIARIDRKSTRLNSSHAKNSYA